MGLNHLLREPVLSEAAAAEKPAAERPGGRAKSTGIC
jgi:hypothetical protein